MSFDDVSSTMARLVLTGLQSQIHKPWTTKYYYVLIYNSNLQEQIIRQMYLVVLDNYLILFDNDIAYKLCQTEYFIRLIHTNIELVDTLPDQLDKKLDINRYVKLTYAVEEKVNNSNNCQIFYIFSKLLHETESLFGNLRNMKRFDIINKYEEVGVINVPGQKGKARIYVAIHRPTGKKYAIKAILKSKHDKIRITNEFLVMSTVRHRNILDLKDFLETEESLYLVMDIMSRDLGVKDMLYTEHEAALIFYDIINGLKYLHSLDVIHCDLKLENILFDKKNKVKIADFGLAQINRSITHYGGTIGYAAPEVLFESSCTKAVDLFGAGVVLYVMLTGRFPWRPALNKKYTSKDIIEATKKCDYVLNDELSSDVLDLIQKLLQPNPTERLTCKEVLEHEWIKFHKAKHVSLTNLFKESVQKVVATNQAARLFRQPLLHRRRSLPLSHLYLKVPTTRDRLSSGSNSDQESASPVDSPMSDGFEYPFNDPDHHYPNSSNNLNSNHHLHHYLNSSNNLKSNHHLHPSSLMRTTSATLYGRKSPKRKRYVEPKTMDDHDISETINYKISIHKY